MSMWGSRETAYGALLKLSYCSTSWSLSGSFSFEELAVVYSAAGKAKRTAGRRKLLLGRSAGKADKAGLEC